MRKLFVYIFMSFAYVAQAQKDTTSQKAEKWSDLSTFFIYRADPKLNRPLMWFSHEEGKYFLEARVNFDAKETAGIFLGRTFSKSKKFWITPKIGILFGLNDLGYDGVSPEFNLGGKLKSFSYFAMNQFSIAITKDKPNFLYNYTQFGYKLFPWLQIDYSAQFYYELNSGAVWIDQGPQLLILWNKFYIKPWYTWDPGHTKVRKFICGVGCNF